jgi:lysozyme
MELSAEGLELIKTSEGFCSHCYRDVAGAETIGFGHKLTGAESFPGGIGEAEAEILLAADVKTAEKTVRRLVRVALTQGQFDALVDFCFNLGAGRLAGSTLLRELNLGRHEAAGQQLLYWVYAGGEMRNALKARREAEFQLWRKDEAKAVEAVA